MAPAALSRERLLAYLLGELPASELAQIDARLLADPEFHRAVRKARNDLTADYRRDALSPVERERARRALNLRSGPQAGPAAGHRRERSAAVRPAPAGHHAGSRRSRAWAATLAACVVCGLGIWLALRGTFSGTAAPSGSRPYLPTNSGLVMTAAPVATFVLQLRPAPAGAQPATQTVRLPKGQKSLETQIVVPSAVGRYDLRVEYPSGQFAYPDLVPRTVNRVSYVEVMIPQQRLAAGTYRFRLSQAGPGVPRTLSSYTVNILMQ